MGNLFKSLFLKRESFNIHAMIISYGCGYERSSKPVTKGIRVETIEITRKQTLMVMFIEGHQCSR